MYIKCWGSRGSIPVSGKDYIKYGGDTTCLEIRTKSNDIIIVDTGTGIRRLGNQLIKESLYKYNIIFTHAHWDHIMGLPFLNRFIPNMPNSECTNAHFTVNLWKPYFQKLWLRLISL